MVIKIFTWGMIIGPIAIILELFLRWAINPMNFKEFIEIITSGIKDNYYLIAIVLFAPIVEECLKYAVVRFSVLKNSAFDEPLDAMLYMIIASLGFAAVENLLLIFQQPFNSFDRVISLSAMRFISATFIHALCSGIVGYWLAKSIREPQKKFRLLAKGLALAIFFHACYNFLIWIVDSSQNNTLVFIPLSMIFILISLMSIAVSYNFSLLKKFHSVCKICKTRLLSANH